MADVDPYPTCVAQLRLGREQVERFWLRADEPLAPVGEQQQIEARPWGVMIMLALDADGVTVKLFARSELEA